MTDQTEEMVGHQSDCAVHNEPAYPAGPCDCGVAYDDACAEALRVRDAAWDAYSAAAEAYDRAAADLRRTEWPDR